MPREILDHVSVKDVVIRFGATALNPVETAVRLDCRASPTRYRSSCRYLLSFCSRTCSYNAIPQKKGPKGSRAKVISELRETQKNSELAQMIPNQIQGLGSPPLSPTFFRTPNLLTHELIDACIQAFLTYLYPTMPILHKEQLDNIVSDIGYSEEAYCMISSLSAFVLIQPGIVLKTHDSLHGQSGSSTIANAGAVLLDETLRIRKCYDYFETPTFASVITSFFLFGCFFGLNKHNTAWFHLREATASVQLLGMQDESAYLGGDIVETSSKRRLFWLLFITERQVILFFLEETKCS